MKVEDYKAVRQTGKELTSKIFKLAIENKDELYYAANLLGYWNGRTLVFDSDEEFDMLTEFLIFEKFNQNTNAIQRFYNNKPELSDLEIENMKGLFNFHASLFEVKGVDSNKNTIVLVDLLDPNHKEYTLMDIGLSHSSVAGHIFYTRLLPVQDIYMTSGVSFGFENSFKDKLLGIISLAAFKTRNKLTTTEMFVLMHKKYKQFGMNVKTV